MNTRTQGAVYKGIVSSPPRRKNAQTGIQTGPIEKQAFRSCTSLCNFRKVPCSQNGVICADRDSNPDPRLSSAFLQWKAAILAIVLSAHKRDYFMVIAFIVFCQITAALCSGRPPASTPVDWPSRFCGIVRYTSHCTTNALRPRICRVVFKILA